MTPWERIGAAVTHRRSWTVALLVLGAAGTVIALAGSNADADKPPIQLPPSSESAEVTELGRHLPGGDRIPAVLVVSRRDNSAMTSRDVEAANSARQRMLSAAGVSGPPLVLSPDGRAAVAPIPLAAASGTELIQSIDMLRRSVAGAPVELTLKLTGGPAFAADIGDAMSSANIVLVVVTASVVAVLLIITYRSPVLWLIPLAVIGFADGLSTAVGSAVAHLTRLTFDGATAGITSVLVFGAGTNYALLLISRYREELTRATDHRAALRTAVSRAGPAVVGQQRDRRTRSVDPGLRRRPATRSLGVHAAIGLAIAELLVLLVLPPLLSLFGMRLFWPFIPHRGTRIADASGICMRSPNGR